MPFDPVFDLSLVRATYAFRRALELAPHDFLSIMGLEKMYEARLMNEAALPLLDRLVALQPINQLQRKQQSLAESERVQTAAGAWSGPFESTAWKNLAELDQLVSDELSKGQAGTAAETLERAYPPAKAPWEIVNRIATLRLHLGEPEKARALWQEASSVPRPAVREARIGRGVSGRRPVRRGPARVRAGIVGRPRSLRGPLRPGRARTGRRPRQRRLRARPRRDRIGPLRRRPIGRPGDRVGVSRFASKETSRSISSKGSSRTR